MSSGFERLLRAEVMNASRALALPLFYFASLKQAEWKHEIAASAAMNTAFLVPVISSIL